ncbi:hypothetical protein EV193_103206 [Herbihabitans rhizosphaerae]|uniref:Uncharacterized protein n=1 Tax=Herbihabitans rhizosphaerae TaxID=1872711 RepID=A0A4Q7KY09_9PSEU|nr:gephyrin-like molybdotransferase receptor GlpR [Herbihabitans rhizosphaerae]RZS40891.1 hypothetical protein EV193_103206 [Herbihabitans rhizosphaerae]
MPSSLIVVGLVVAWLVVLVPMIVRKRQEVARTADSTLAARVVRSGSSASTAEEDDDEGREEQLDMRDTDDIDVDATAEEIEAEDVDEPHAEEPQPRRYRPGRGGFDPEAAAVAARAKYAYRQRVVLLLLIIAVVTAVVAAVAVPLVWWLHGAVDLVLAGYLSYLRRQVRIEQEVRERRLARMAASRRIREHARPAESRPEHVEDVYEYEEPQPARRERVALEQPPQPRVTRPGTVVVDVDDEDPAFDELDDPDSLPYRRAVGE